MTLIEVMLGLTIMLMSMVAIGQLVDIGSDRAYDARMFARGTRLVQAKMAEVEAGSISVSDGGGQSGAFDDDPAWTWTVDTQPAGPPNLYKVTVKVTRDVRGIPFEIALGQMIFDPAMTGSAAQAEAPPPTDGSTTSGTGTSTGTTGGTTP